MKSLAAGALIAATFTVFMIWRMDGNHADPALTGLSGIVVAAIVVPVATRVRTSSGWRRFEVWFSVLFLNLASVAIEGTLFAPGAAPPSQLGFNLIRLAALSGTVAAIAAGLAQNSISRPSPAGASSRHAYDWALRIGVGALTYLVAYFVIGGLNYTFVTHPYYQSHVGSLTVPSPQVVFTYEPIRGILIALSVLPMVLAVEMRVAQLAVGLGALLFVVGGLAVLLPQTSLPLFLRVASLWEVFAQNVITGAACAYLFRLTPGYQTGSSVTAP